MRIVPPKIKGFKEPKALEELKLCSECGAYYRDKCGCLLSKLKITSSSKSP